MRLRANRPRALAAAYRPGQQARVALWDIGECVYLQEDEGGCVTERILREIWWMEVFWWLE